MQRHTGPGSQTQSLVPSQCGFRRCHPLTTLLRSQPGSSPELWVSRIFAGVSLFRHDWLNHWLPDWTQSQAPLPSLEMRAVSPGSKPQPSNHMAGSFHHSQPLWVHLVVINSGVLQLVCPPPWITKAFQSLGKLKGFRSPLPRTQDKDQTNSLF